MVVWNLHVLKVAARWLPVGLLKRWCTHRLATSVKGYVGPHVAQCRGMYCLLKLSQPSWHMSIKQRGKCLMLRCKSLHVGHMVHMLCFMWVLGMSLISSLGARVKLLDWSCQRVVASSCWMKFIAVS